MLSVNISFFIFQMIVFGFIDNILQKYRWTFLEINTSLNIL